MTAAVVLQALAAGVWLVPAAMLCDRVAAVRRWPRRAVWAAALVALLLLPASAPWRGGRVAAGTAHDAVAGGGTTSATFVVWSTVTASVRDRLTAAVATLDPAERWLTAGWLATSLLVGLVYLGGARALARRSRQWKPRLVLGQPVLLSAITGPAVIGLARPRIVLPAWALDLDCRSLSAVLEHERQHVCARDPWLVYLSWTATVLMPWHPAVWWMARRLRLAVELDCDRRVLARGTGRVEEAVEYGEMLLAIGARNGSVAPLTTPALIDSSSSLSRRISAMLPMPIRFPRLQMTSAGLGALVLVAAACGTPTPTARDSSESGGDVSGVASSEAMAAAAYTFRPGTPGVENPVPVESPRPGYTSEALRRRIDGHVAVEVIVGVDGRVVSARVTRSLDPDFGLDEQALDAARRWRFEPGRFEGRAVPMRVTLEMQFVTR